MPYNMFQIISKFMGEIFGLTFPPISSKVEKCYNLPPKLFANLLDIYQKQPEYRARKHHNKTIGSHIAKREKKWKVGEKVGISHRSRKK